MSLAVHLGHVHETAFPKHSLEASGGSHLSLLKQDSLNLDCTGIVVNACPASFILEMSDWESPSETLLMTGFPRGLCVFPGTRAAPLCSSSSSSAWSCRASLDTAQAEAGRSVFSGPWKTPLCSLSLAHQWAGSRAAPCRRSVSPTGSHQKPTHH